jgi:3-oxoadipate enol-lactonase
MFLETGLGPLYFEVEGEGPPIAFVSGWAMSCECWRPAVKVLRKKHKCLIYDQLGVARSQPASVHARFGIEDHAEDLHNLLETAGMFDALIVAHDLGAMFSAELANAHPQDVNSVAIVSPRPGLPNDDIKSLAVFTPASLALRELASYPLIRSLVQRRFRRAPQPYRDRLFTDFAQLSPRAAYETALSASAPDSVDLVDHLVARAKLPVLLVCGDKDKRGSAEARRLFKIGKQSRLATMRDCGFLPMLEYPTQFAKLVEGFYAENAARWRVEEPKPDRRPADR